MLLAGVRDTEMGKIVTLDHLHREGTVLNPSVVSSCVIPSGIPWNMCCFHFTDLGLREVQ